MAFLLPNLQPSLLAQSKSKDKSNLHQNQTLSPQKPTSHFPLSSSSLHASTAQVAQLSTTQDNKHPKDEFYLNLGLAVRTIREDLPLIFIKDLNYDIYRYLSHPMCPSLHFLWSLLVFSPTFRHDSNRVLIPL